MSRQNVVSEAQQLPGILDFGSYSESLGYSPASTENSTVRSEELTRHSMSLGGNRVCQLRHSVVLGLSHRALACKYRALGVTTEYSVLNTEYLGRHIEHSVLLGNTWFYLVSLGFTK